MIRILHVLAGLKTGGVESFVINLRKALPTEEYSFDFLLREEKGKDPDKFKFFEDKGSKIFTVSNFPDRVLANYRETKKFFRDKGSRYQIIHIHANSLVYILPIIFAGKYTEAKVIVHSHNTMTKSKWMRWIHNFNKRYIERFKVIKLACSNEAGKWMFSSGFKVVPNSIDVSAFEIYRDNRTITNDLTNTTIRFISVGRLERQKNYEFAISLMEKLKSSLDVKYVIAGEGALRDVLQEEIKKKGLCDKIKLIGNSADIPSLFQEADIFLMPSLYEGFSIALLEAQSTGLPCIISDKISEECVICRNVYRVSLCCDEWIARINKILDNNKKDFDSRNNEIVANSIYGLSGLKKSIEQIYQMM